jgi:hypothetical protein
VCRNPMLSDLRATLVNVARWRTTPRQKMPGKHGCVWRQSGTSLQSTRGTAAEFSIATSSSAIDQTAPRPAVVLVVITRPLGHRQ